MAKYDSLSTEIKNSLANAKKILIALPAGADIDKLSSGLALFLSLKNVGKEVSIVGSDTVRVAEAHLFGIDNVKQEMPVATAGDFILTLEGVAVPDTSTETGWKVPSLSTMDYIAENNNLNLVFHVIPGQSFKPTNIVPKYQSTGFDLILNIGGATQSQEGVKTISIDKQLDATSVAEMLTELIPAIGLNLDTDTASNLLAGIFTSTSNLTTSNLTADTFMAVANCLRVGGKKPEANEIPDGQGLDFSGLNPEPQAQPQPEVQSQPEIVQPAPAPIDANFVTPPIVPEVPRGESVVPEGEIEAEPDWLTPKIFKAGQG